MAGEKIVPPMILETSMARFGALALLFLPCRAGADALPAHDFHHRQNQTHAPRLRSLVEEVVASGLFHIK